MEDQDFREHTLVSSLMRLGTVSIRRSLDDYMSLDPRIALAGESFRVQSLRSLMNLFSEATNLEHDLLLDPPFGPCPYPWWRRQALVRHHTLVISLTRLSVC